MVHSNAAIAIIVVVFLVVLSIVAYGLYLFRIRGKAALGGASSAGSASTELSDYPRRQYD